MSCHRASISQVSGGGLNLETGDVGLRMLDAPSKTESTGCRDEYLIDFYAPHNSLLLKLIDQSKFIKLNATTCKRQPMPQSAAFMSAVDYACVASWVTEVTKTKTPTPLPDTQTFSPNNNATALTKAKYILHGGAATDAEFTAVTEAQGDIDPEALSNIIASWESTPEYQLKIKDFLALSLQQMPFGDSQYRDQLNNITKAEITKIDAVSLRKNFEESFVRTASEIVTNNEDFRKVITTRKWEMTTAMMAALVYLDKPNQPETRNYYLDATPGNFFAEMAYFQPSDYTDWRQVTIVQSEIPATWENTADFTAQLRSIANDGQLLLRYPRVGFFSSPVFLNRWATNNDNQFRVTTSQTLIVALNKTVSPGDATAHITENGIPAEHADKTSACYQCHRHLDPLRLVFSNFLVPRYRSKNSVTTATTQPSFSFYGVTQNFDTVDEFASILAEHPELPIGWVQKLCVWGNSSRCDESDPEFLRLVDYFKANNYDLKMLIRQFFSSPIFTGTRVTQTHETHEYIISLSRGNHFCRAFTARANQINQAANTTGFVPPCGPEAFSPVTKDTYRRGLTDLVQATRLGWFDSKSIDSYCARVAPIAVTSAGLFSTDATVTDTLNYLTRFMVGLPKNHRRYDLVLAGLTRNYELATKPANCADPLAQMDTVTCGYGLSKYDGLRAAWFTACTAPDLIGIGM